MPATHTPAPWTVTDQHSDYVMSVVRRGNGMPDMQTGSEPDAALMSAAPEMLVALIEADEDLDLLGIPEADMTRVLIRAAIAKATAQ